MNKHKMITAASVSFLVLESVALASDTDDFDNGVVAKARSNFPARSNFEDLFARLSVVKREIDNREEQKATCQHKLEKYLEHEDNIEEHEWYDFVRIQSSLTTLNQEIDLLKSEAITIEAQMDESIGQRSPTTSNPCAEFVDMDNLSEYIEAEFRKIEAKIVAGFAGPFSGDEKRTNK